MAKSKTVSAVAIIIVVVAIFSIYVALTFPQTIFEDNISFDLGTEAKVVEFKQQALRDKIQVKVSLESGTALWRARIMEEDTVIWEHTAAQSGQTTYESEWIALPDGAYNFTFGTVGGGSLESVVTVSTKGGIW
ncbi:MAG: hypothetical protein ACOWW1_00980 [archaeon]